MMVSPRKKRTREEEEKIEEDLRRNLYLVRDWLRVIWRHPCSLAVYQVWMQHVRKSAVCWLRLLKRKVYRKLRLAPQAR